MKQLIISCVGFCYRNLLKQIFFLQDPEKVHRRTVRLGERLGGSAFAKRLFSAIFRTGDPVLSQQLFGLRFESPVGLAAGFDYEARLTQILPCLGFGFGTVGTLTNLPYEGNPPPMLGRLPRSRSLMVNKGFKNLGIAATLEKFGHAPFAYPVGVSIGKTNTAGITTQRGAVEDVVAAFRKAEASGVPFSYYELNISCPNLQGTVEFYEPRHLDELLSGIEALGITKPLWIKMPISKTDDEIHAMMETIIRRQFVQAAIFGNLQRDRHNPALDPEEVKKFSVGNFSGVPCRERSDELIRLVFKKYGSRIKIIGCGGVFSAEDAYRKIRLGASLVQLITGLVYEGPQLVTQINRDLAHLARRDGYRSITEAAGTAAR